MSVSFVLRPTPFQSTQGSGWVHIVPPMGELATDSVVNNLGRDSDWGDMGSDIRVDGSVKRKVECASGQEQQRPVAQVEVEDSQ